MVPLYDTLRPRRFPIVNWMLISLNGMAFYYELKLGEAELFRFIHTWGLVPLQLTLNSPLTWLTIFTSMFLHGAVTSRVAWWAHIGGFVFGFIAIWLFVPRRY